MSENRPAAQSYKFGEFILSPDQRILMRSGQRVHLTPRVFHLLQVLVENRGRLVSKETLLREIWKDSFVEEGNLNSTVSRLRKILGETPDQKLFIETVPRLGYRFLADVETVSSDLPIKPSTVAPQRWPSVRRSWLILLVAGLLIVSIMSLVAYRKFGSSAVDSLSRQKNIPFRLTNDPAAENRPYLTMDGKIRFTQYQGNQPSSFVMNSDGSNVRRDASIPDLQWGLWSPDGKKVAFFKDNDESHSFYLANADGSNQITLPFAAGNMDWSRDSSKIVYQAGRPDADIFIYTIETGKIQPVVSTPAFDCDPALSPDGTQIAFVSDRDGNFEIYIQNLDGSELRRLTEHPAHDSFPAFSPDGTQIAFNSDRENDNFNVYLMNLDGTGLRALTDQKSNETISPGCWSSDGTTLYLLSDQNGTDNIFSMAVEPFAPVQILADATRDLRLANYSPDGRKLLYEMSAETSGEIMIADVETKRSTSLLKTDTSGTFPAFSPDGASIVFQDRIGGNMEIFIMQSDGSGMRNLTINPARDTMPAWSPDGSHIVFTSNRDGNYDLMQVYVMNVDGSNQHRIYYSNAMSQRPTWSPDGRQIVFANDKEEGRSGNFEIFAIEPETIQPEKRLTFRRRYDVAPSFSPDGSRLAFVSNLDGNWEIYIMGSDGSKLIRLTRDAAEDTDPSWSPDGKRIIFSSNRSGRFAIYEMNAD
jgi:Tol biopolymer transport system component/DNA-binding winged helix-turn-helix (wHTH) protein